MLSQSVQVVFAICLIIIFLIIGLSVYNYEYLKTFNLPTITESSRKKVIIFDGIKDSSISNNEKYLTIKDPSSDKPPPSFRDINPTKDTKGGIEFTYSFWLYIKGDRPKLLDGARYKPDEGLTADNINNQTILFVKGSKELSTYKNICGEDKRDYMVKCPLVKLERNNSQLTVEFNTVPSKSDGTEYIEGIKENSKNKCNDHTNVWKKSNAHKITLGNINRAEFEEKWILVSIILKDTSPSEHLPLRNKARCVIYINNFLELDTYIDGSLEHMKNNLTTVNINKGPLHIFPVAEVATNKKSYIPSTGSHKHLMMANLIYYNYSLEQSEITNIFNSGPPSYIAPSVGSNENLDLALLKADKSNEKKTTSP